MECEGQCMPILCRVWSLGRFGMDWASNSNNDKINLSLCDLKITIMNHPNLLRICIYLHFMSSMGHIEMSMFLLWAIKKCPCFSSPRLAFVYSAFSRIARWFFIFFMKSISVARSYRVLSALTSKYHHKCSSHHGNEP